MQNERLAKFLRVTIYLQKFSIQNEKVVKAEDNSLFPNRVSFELTSKYVFNAKLSFIATYISAPFKNHIFFSFTNLRILPVSFTTSFYYYLWRHNFRNKSMCILPVMEKNVNPLLFD